MKKLYKTAFLLAFSALSSVNVLASSLVGVTGTLKNIEKPVNVAIQQAEKYYEENRGGELTDAPYNLVDTSINPYLSALQIKPNYNILLKFAQSKPGIDVERDNVEDMKSPVDQALLDKSILLVPIFNEGEEVVSSWECITDADKEIQQFLGDVGAQNLTRSYIATHTANKYLTNCIYNNNDALYVVTNAP
jgi:hypothetical protein